MSRFCTFCCFSFLYFLHPFPTCALFYSSLTSTLIHIWETNVCRQTCIFFPFFFVCSLKRRTRRYSNSLGGFGSHNVPVTFISIITYLQRWWLMQSLYKPFGLFSFALSYLLFFKSSSAILLQIDALLWGGENPN